MKYLGLLLCLLAPAAWAQGYLNPPIYATGYISAPAGTNTTTNIRQAANPNNLNILNAGPISAWNVVMPSPPFDGQIMTVGCPGGDVAVLNVMTNDGTTIGAGGNTSCTAASLSPVVYQYQAQPKTWLPIFNTTGGGGGTGNVNVIQWDSVNVGAPSNYGTSPGAVTVPGVNAFVTNTVPVTGTFFQATQPVSGTFWQATQPVSCSLCATAANQEVTAAGSSASSAQAIQGVTGGVAVPVTGTFGLGTTGGWTPLRLSALTNTAVAIKGAQGQLGMLQCYNPSAVQTYIQIYNVASGSVTVGTTTPTLSIPIAPTATGGWALSNPGIQFSTAISAAATTTATGGTAPGIAADCNVVYN